MILRRATLTVVALLIAAFATTAVAGNAPAGVRMDGVGISHASV